MDTQLKDFIISLIIIALWIPTGISKKQDVCFWKTLNATCRENQIIQMKHALYGRMAAGTCIPEDVGYNIGCQVDVLGHMDSVCSGRQSCQLRVPDDYLANIQKACLRGLESYLQLQYNCIAVHTSPTPCAGKAIRVTGESGLLANVITERTNQGSTECPWEVRGSPGQKVRLILHDNGVWNSLTSDEGDSGIPEAGIQPPERSNICHIYARVTDVSAETSVTLCKGEAREKEIYLSETEGVRVALTDPKHSKHSYFVLRYEVIGCLTYKAPEGATTAQHENDITVTCPVTGSEWKVSCDGTRWQTEGNVTNCTGIGNGIVDIVDEPSMSLEAPLKVGLTLSQGLVIAFFLSIAVLIAVIILVIGIVVLRRRQGTVIESRGNPWMNSTDRTPPPPYTCKENVPMLTKDKRTQQALLEKGYIAAPKRQAAGLPNAMAPSGRFPPLPLPPTEETHCTVHGTLNRARYPRDSSHNTLTRPYTEHMNESPRFLQHTRSKSDTKNHFYHELDPEHINVRAGPPRDTKDPDNDTTDLDTSGAPLPDVLSSSSIGLNNLDNV